MPSIESLPPELLLEVVNWVDKLYDDHGDTFRSPQVKDLGNLRRTCKKVSKVAAVPLFHTVSLFSERSPSHR